eukprot:2221291-Rhodomonas_salina.1
MSQKQHRTMVHNLSLAVTVGLLDGTVPDFNITSSGDWSPHPYVVQGLRWAVLVAVVISDHNQELEVCCVSGFGFKVFHVLGGFR